jgi:hypothetical protein
MIENTYHWPADGESRSWTQFWVTTFTTPVGQARAVGILYSTDNGNRWTQQPMEHSCVLGEQDVWHVNLGTFPAATRIRYAIEAIDPSGASHWDNNHGKDHYALIGSPADLRVAG